MHVRWMVSPNFLAENCKLKENSSTYTLVRSKKKALVTTHYPIFSLFTVVMPHLSRIIQMLMSDQEKTYNLQSTRLNLDEPFKTDLMSVTWLTDLKESMVNTLYNFQSF